jgi:hypothetical protein
VSLSAPRTVTALLVRSILHRSRREPRINAACNVRPEINPSHPLLGQSSSCYLPAKYTHHQTPNIPQHTLQLHFDFSSYPLASVLPPPSTHTYDARARWEGRPRTPPFRWGDGVEVLPPHDTWLRELDLKVRHRGMRAWYGTAGTTSASRRFGGQPAARGRAGILWLET